MRTAGLVRLCVVYFLQICNMTTLTFTSLIYCSMVFMHFTYLFMEYEAIMHQSM